MKTYIDQYRCLIYGELCRVILNEYEDLYDILKTYVGWCTLFMFDFSYIKQIANSRVANWLSGITG